MGSKSCLSCAVGVQPTGMSSVSSSKPPDPQPASQPQLTITTPTTATSTTTPIASPNKRKASSAMPPPASPASAAAGGTASAASSPSTPTSGGASKKSLPIFRNQVGGHMPLLWNSGRICKPLMASEYNFYKSLETELPALVPFIPTYYGTMEVDQLAQANNNAAAAAAAASPSAASTSSASSASSSSSAASTAAGKSVAAALPSHDQHPPQHTHREAQPDHKHAISIPHGTTAAHASDNGAASAAGIDTEMNESIQADDEDGDAGARHRRTDSSTAAALAAAHANGTQLYSAWGWTCKEKRWIEKMMADKLDTPTAKSNTGAGVVPTAPAPPATMPDGSPRFLKYIVLEDLTYKYRNPCILDLKIGTRQHGDDEPPAKVKSKSLKCARTTSASLGLRVCGMQVYRPMDSKYLFRDKYFGRTLDRDGFHANLRDYLWDGTRVRTEIASQLLTRLLPFQHVIAQEAHVRRYRFYSSSLLLVYEGYEAEYDPNKKSTAAAPTTAATATAAAPTAAAASTAAASSASAAVSDKKQKLNDGNSSSSSSSSSGSSSSSAKPSHSTSASAWTTGNALPSGVYAATLSSLSEADVRIIDFAHTTKLAATDQSANSVDTGLLFGFENLINSLQRILTEEAEQNGQVLTAKQSALATAPSAGRTPLPIAVGAAAPATATAAATAAPTPAVARAATTTGATATAVTTSAAASTPAGAGAAKPVVTAPAAAAAASSFSSSHPAQLNPHSAHQRPISH